MQRSAQNTLKPADYPLLGLINLARLKLDDLLNVKRTLELINTLEGASNHLSRPDLDSRTGFRHREWQKCWRLIKPGQKCGAKL
jgi:hypothetical protein